jgi:hypothetical protein
MAAEEYGADISRAQFVRLVVTMCIGSFIEWWVLCDAASLPFTWQRVCALNASYDFQFAEPASTVTVPYALLQV